MWTRTIFDAESMRPNGKITSCIASYLNVLASFSLSPSFYFPFSLTLSLLSLSFSRSLSLLLSLLLSPSSSLSISLSLRFFRSIGILCIIRVFLKRTLNRAHRTQQQRGEWKQSQKQQQRQRWMNIKKSRLAWPFSLSRAVSSNDWLTRNGNYHINTKSAPIRSVYKCEIWDAIENNSEIEMFQICISNASDFCHGLLIAVFVCFVGEIEIAALCLNFMDLTYR